MFAVDVGPLVPWEAHTDVWLLIAGLVAVGGYVARVVQPVAVAAGEPPITTAQKRWFAFAVVVMWVASDWPLHDIAEGYLYSIHMVQHELYTFVIPPALLLATPEWLARLIVGEGRASRVLRTLSRPVLAAVLYNAVVVFTHWPWAVQTSIDYGAFHYFVHFMVIGTALLAWMPICGPIPEWRVTPLVKGIHLFLLSIIPTVPSSFLTAADGVVYPAYDHDQRLWGISVLNDQQMAGVVMKIVTGFYLWAIILVIFLKAAREESSGDRKFRGTLVPSGSLPAEPADGGEGHHDGPSGQDGPRTPVDVVGR